MSRNISITSIRTKASSNQLRATQATGSSQTTRVRGVTTIHMLDPRVDFNRMFRAIQIQLGSEAILWWKQQALNKCPRPWVRQISIGSSKTMEMARWTFVIDVWVSLVTWEMVNRTASTVRKLMLRSRCSNRRATSHSSRATSHSSIVVCQTSSKDHTPDQDCSSSSSSNTSTQTEMSKSCKTRTWVVETTATPRPLLSSNNTLSSPKKKKMTNSRERANTINA